MSDTNWPPTGWGKSVLVSEAKRMLASTVWYTVSMPPRASYQCPKAGSVPAITGEVVTGGEIIWRLRGTEIQHCPWCGAELFLVFMDLLDLIVEHTISGTGGA